MVVRRTARDAVEVARIGDAGGTEAVDRAEPLLGALYTYELRVVGRGGQVEVAATSQAVSFDPRISYSPFAATPGGLFAPRRRRARPARPPGRWRRRRATTATPPTSRPGAAGSRS